MLRVIFRWNGLVISMLSLPAFKPNRQEQVWLTHEQETAKLVQLLWRHGSKSDRRDPGFLELLIRSSWSNGGGDDARRRWRNQYLAGWLGLLANTRDEDIAAELSHQIGLSRRDAQWVVNTPSGITNYYKAYRTAFMKQVRKHSELISKAFELVSKRSVDLEAKIEQVANLILDLPTFTGPNKRRALIMNGLAPVLACLDPQLRFPIMNAPTRPLLRMLGHIADAEGAKSLSRLIGQHGIKDSLHLDVYAASKGKKFKASRRHSKVKVRDPKTVGNKAEEDAVVSLARRRIKIRKRHNTLINKFRSAVEWKHTPKESEYDLLIENWKPGRWLLIEAKTETEGVAGRTQLRQAIGQLFDYRWRSFRNGGDVAIDKIDLAVLTRAKPPKDFLELLDDLGIEALWFERDKLTGTLSLI